jgi:hypothetical protein
VALPQTICRFVTCAIVQDNIGCRVCRHICPHEVVQRCCQPRLGASYIKLSWSSGVSKSCSTSVLSYKPVQCLHKTGIFNSSSSSSSSSSTRWSPAHSFFSSTLLCCTTATSGPRHLHKSAIISTLCTTSLTHHRTPTTIPSVKQHSKMNHNTTCTSGISHGLCAPALCTSIFTSMMRCICCSSGGMRYPWPMMVPENRSVSCDPLM